MAEENMSYALGDAVWHATHGDGAVTGLDNSNPVITFASGKTITVLRASPKLRPRGTVDAVERQIGLARQRLREWRRNAAELEKRPPYDIATDAMIDAIAAARPDSLEALARIPGVGQTRLHRYGDQILKQVNSAADNGC